MGVESIKRSINLQNALTKAANSGTESTETSHFNSYLEQAVNNNNAKNNPLGDLLASLTDMTRVDPEKASSYFAQAITEDEITRKRKKTIPSDDFYVKEAPKIYSDPNIDKYNKNNIDYIAQAPQDNQVKNLTNQDNQDPDLIAQIPTEAFDPNRPAQEPELLTPENVNTIGIRTNKLEITPFQLFMDKAIDALDSLSLMEHRVNDLIDLYTQGKVSIEEVTTETAKLSMAISFATTVITQVTTTFKEIQNLPI